ncbi:MAG TPA: DMT family transporter, partial [Croceibacterium sp.]|nr:DMT family transporter [Croceibacterium sp.]
AVRGGVSAAASLLWVPFTLAAAAGQVLRNGAQAQLTAKIGTLGATQVRFVFGLPFAVAFLGLAHAFTGESLPPVSAAAVGWALLGGVSQIAATALMLIVMDRRAFGVAYAYIKTEPVLVAVLGAILIGDRLSAPAWLAIGTVTIGVLLVSTKAGEVRNLVREGRMIATGLAAGAFFGLSAIAFRGAIIALPEGGFLIRALTVVVMGLSIQTGLLGIWLALRDRAAFVGALREWRVSMWAGFLGAFASAGWFIAFSLTAAANVRTLALVELPLAGLLSGRLTGRRMAWRELAGLAVVLAGLAILLVTAPS